MSAGLPDDAGDGLASARLVLRRYTGVRLVLVCHGCAPTVVGEILPPQVAHRVITDVGDALSGVGPCQRR